MFEDHPLDQFGVERAVVTIDASSTRQRFPYDNSAAQLQIDQVNGTSCQLSQVRNEVSAFDNGEWSLPRNSEVYVTFPAGRAVCD